MRRGPCVLVTAVALVATACSSDEGVSDFGDGDCESRYFDVSRADSRQRLNAKLVSEVDPAVVRLRRQGTGPATGFEHQPAEIVDLLNGKGRRVMQVEVFQLANGRWFAGQWGQCID